MGKCRSHCCGVSPSFHPGLGAGRRSRVSFPRRSAQLSGETQRYHTRLGIARWPLRCHRQSLRSAPRPDSPRIRTWRFPGYFQTTPHAAARSLLASPARNSAASRRGRTVFALHRVRPPWSRVRSSARNPPLPCCVEHRLGLPVPGPGLQLSGSRSRPVFQEAPRPRPAGAFGARCQKKAEVEMGAPGRCGRHPRHWPQLKIPWPEVQRAHRA